MNIEPAPKPCTKCAHSDWVNTTPLGFPVCKVSGKSALAERSHDGTCTRAGLNYQQDQKRG